MSHHELSIGDYGRAWINTHPRRFDIGLDAENSYDEWHISLRLAFISLGIGRWKRTWIKPNRSDPEWCATCNGPCKDET